MANGGEPPRPASADASSPAAELAAASETADAASLREVVATAPRDVAPGGAASPAAPDAPVATFRGRCVAAEDGRPLAGCEVKATTQHVATTADDGTFVVGHPPGHSDLSITGPQRAHRLIRPGEVTTGVTYELGDVPLVRGFPVTGRVVDANGAPVPDTVLWVTGTSVGADARLGSTTDGKSGADGAFALSSLLGAGRWFANVMNARLRDSGAFTVDAERGAAPLLLVVVPHGPERTMRGVVVDDVGEPVADVLLATRSAGAMDKTDADGSFSITARPTRDDDELVVEMPGRCESDRMPRPVRWGSDDVRIVLRRAASLTVDVVDDSGVPVKEFGVWLGSEPHLVLGQQQSRAHGTHENGRAVVAPAQRGRSVLRVFPHAVDLVPSEPVEIDVVDGMPPVRVVVERALPCLVEVVDARGAAVSAATVDLVRMRAPVEQSLGEAREPGKAGKTTTWFRQLPQPERIARATTSAAGGATLLAPRSLRGTLLRCDMAPFAPFHLVDPALRPGVPLRIVLAGSGAIAGKVVLDGTPPASIRIELRDAGGNRVRVRGQWWIELDHDGSFAIDRLAAGTWNVVANLQVVRTRSGEARPFFVPLAATERAVTVVAGETTKVEITGVPRASGSIRGSIRSDGLDPAGWNVDLVRADAAARSGTFPLAPDGSFVAERLLPGRYRVAVMRSNASTYELGGIIADEVEISPDVTLVREFAFVPRRLVLELQNPDGSPFTGRFDVRCGAEIDWTKTGPRFVLDPAPELPITVRAEDGEWSAPISMPRDQREFSTPVVVPQPRR